MRLLCTLLILLVFSKNSTAQKGLRFLILPDSSSPIKPIGLKLSYNIRQSQIFDNFYTLEGFRAGITIGKRKHELTLGYLWQNYENPHRLINYKAGIKKLLLPSTLIKPDYHYYNLSFIPFVVDKYRWRLGFPIGIGKGKTEFNDLKNNYSFYQAQVGVYGEFKASRYFGLRTQVGYRKSASKENINLSGMYYAVGVKLYAGVMFRDTKALYKTRHNLKN